MKKFLAYATVLLGMVAPVSFGVTFPVVGYVQVNPLHGTQPGGFNISTGTVSTMTITGLMPGQCVVTGVGGILATIPCGSGGGGSVGGSIVSSPQNQLAYYNLAGSSTSLQGSNGLSTDGAGNLNAQIITASSVSVSGNINGVNGSFPGILYGFSVNEDNGLYQSGVNVLYDDGSNIRVGKSALANNTTGSNSAGVGHQALTNQTSGGNNTAVGYQSLIALHTGLNNTGLGTIALFQTTGDFNTAVGAVAGATNGNGASNVFVGAGADAASPSLTNAIAIGRNAIVSANNTAVIGTGANTATAVNLIVTSVTVGGLPSGKCVQTGAGGLLSASSSACGSGGSGPSGQVIVSTVNSIGYYSVAGSSNVITGLVPGTSGYILATAGASLPPYWTPNTGSSGAGIYPASATASFPFGLSASTITLSSSPINVPLYVNAAGQIASRSIRLNTSDVTDTLAPSNGGTGQNLYTDGEILIGNSSTGGLSTGTLLAGSNVTISTATNSLTISAAGGGAATLPLPGGATNYIQVSNTLQSNTTFYVTSGTVNGPFNLLSPNTNLQWIPGTGSGGQSTLWAQGASAVSPSSFLLAFSSLNNGTTNFRMLFSNTNTLQFQDGSNVTQSSFSNTGVIYGKGLSITGGSSSLYGNLAVSSGILLSGSAGTNGQVLTSGGAGTVPTWATGSGGAVAASGLTDVACVRTSTGVVTCTFPSGGTAFSNGNYVQAFTTNLTITLTTGAGTGTTFYLYWLPGSSTLLVDTSGANFTGVACNAGCTLTSTGATGYPADVKPIARLTAGNSVANQWDTFTTCLPNGASGCIDDRGFLGTAIATAGSGLASSTTNGSKSLSTDKTITPQKFFGAGVPTTVSGSTWGDFYLNTTSSVSYVCAISTGCAGGVPVWNSQGGSGGTPGTPFTSVQYNNAGSFAGSTNFQFSGTSVTITGALGVAAGSSTFINSGSTDKYIASFATSTVTGGTSNGVWITTSGFTLINSTTTRGALNIGPVGPTTAAQGLFFGDDSTANFYRQSAGIVRTDGAFWGVGNNILPNITDSGTGNSWVRLNATDVRLGPSAGSLFVLKNGAVGIGTATPTTKLQLSTGTFTVDGSTGGISVTASGGITTTGLFVSSGIIVSTPTATVASTATLTSTMSVVLVSVPANTAWITMTLPSAANNPGSEIMIYKVDSTTGAVLIKGAGSELIEGTNTIRLDATTQHASLHSLGSFGWGSGLGGIQRTPSYFGPDDMTSGNSIGASSRTYTCPFDIPVPVFITGFRYFDQSGSPNSNLVFGLYDQNGIIVTSTGPVASPGFGVQTISYGTPVLVAPGQYRWAIQVSNNVLQIGADNINGSNGSTLCSYKDSGTMGLPNPYGLPGSSPNRKLTVKILVNGGRTVE